MHRVQTPQVPAGFALADKSEDDPQTNNEKGINCRLFHKIKDSLILNIILLLKNKILSNMIIT